MTKFELETSALDGECDYNECEEDSWHLWFGVSHGNNVMYRYAAEYCSDHSESHAETKEALMYLGSIREIDQ